MKAWLLTAAAFAMTPAAWAAVETPSFTPSIGARIDLTTNLADSTGTARTLGAWMAGRPALVTFGYDNCPNLCGVVQRVQAIALQQSGLTTADYVPLFVTIDPNETSADATAAKARLADAAGAAAAAPWMFLTGAAVEHVSDQFGIGTVERARIKQFVHPVATFAVTPDGRIARVLPGLETRASDLRLALVEASAGKLGTLVDQIVLFCAGYDPSKGQYSSLVEALLRVACGVLLVLGLGALGVLRWREKH